MNIIVYPDGTVIEDDMDELLEALQKGDVTQVQYEQALDTSEKLKKGLLSDVATFKEYIQKLYGKVAM